MSVSKPKTLEDIKTVFPTAVEYLRYPSGGTYANELAFMLNGEKRRVGLEMDNEDEAIKGLIEMATTTR